MSRHKITNKPRQDLQDNLQPCYLQTNDIRVEELPRENETSSSLTSRVSWGMRPICSNKHDTSVLAGDPDCVIAIQFSHEKSWRERNSLSSRWNGEDVA